MLAARPYPALIMEDSDVGGSTGRGRGKGGGGKGGGSRARTPSGGSRASSGAGSDGGPPSPRCVSGEVRLPGQY